MLGTWVTEKFGKKLGAVTAFWSFHLIWHHFIPAKYPITPTLYVNFKPFGCILYAYVALSVHT